MRHLVSLDLTYTTPEKAAIYRFNDLYREVLSQMPNQQFVNDEDAVLRLIVLYHFVQNFRENNLFHADFWGNQITLINPQLLAMKKFVQDVDLKKVTKEDTQTFNDIQVFMKDYIEVYDASKAYFREHLLTAPREIAVLKRIYEAMNK